MATGEPSRLRELRHIVNHLTARIQAGGERGVDALRELFELLLRCTVLDRRAGGRLRCRQQPPQAGVDTVWLIDGWNEHLSPVPLANGRFLRFTMELVVSRQDQQISVSKSCYQYQTDSNDRQTWIFRYDYSREQDGVDIPAAHVQIRGRLAEEGALPKTRALGRVHFPTQRVSLESVLRLLIRDFSVATQQPAEVWRPLLALTESEFIRISHRPEPLP